MLNLSLILLDCIKFDIKCTYGISLKLTSFVSFSANWPENRLKQRNIYSNDSFLGCKIEAKEKKYRWFRWSIIQKPVSNTVYPYFPRLRLGKYSSPQSPVTSGSYFAQFPSWAVNICIMFLKSVYVNDTLKNTYCLTFYASNIWIDVNPPPISVHSLLLQ